MINYYELEVKGKNIYRFFDKIIANKINVFDVIYKKDSLIFKVSYEDYLKIDKIKTIYQINIIEVKGIKKVKKLIIFYKTYLIFFIISIILVFVYANLIIKIDIKTENEDLRNIVLQELKKNNITLFSTSLSYNNLRNIANFIKSNNKDLIDFIEITKNGLTYEVNIIEKVKKSSEEDLIGNSIVASKNGLILDMYVESGEIIKNKGDYVSKGDIIISSNITKNEEIKNVVSAKGKVYAETWYKVKVTHPKTFKVQINEKGYTKIKLNIFNKDITLLNFKNKSLKKEKTINLFSNSLFTFVIEQKYDSNLIAKEYQENELIQIMENMAKEEILKNLEKDEKILQQKTLKIDTDNDKIDMEVFFKVYENIAEMKKISNAQEQ